MITPMVPTTESELLLVGAVSLGIDQDLSRFLLGAALVLWLPGYALTAALFGRDELDWVQRTLITLGSSISLAILVGFGFSLLGVPLNTLTWGIGLAAVTVGAGTFAWRQPTHRPGLPRLDVWLSMRKRDGLLFGIAALLVVAALGLARLGADGQPQTGFTNLSILPGTGGAVLIGVQNEESSALTYRVVLKTGSAVIAEWPIVRLERGQQWDMPVVLPANQRTGVELVLYRADAPGEIYRRVALGPVPTPGS